MEAWKWRGKTRGERKSRVAFSRRNGKFWWAGWMARIPHLDGRSFVGIFMGCAGSNMRQGQGTVPASTVKSYVRSMTRTGPKVSRSRMGP